MFRYLYITAEAHFAEMSHLYSLLQAFCRLLIFVEINVFEKFFQEYHQSVKQFGSRSGPTYCRA